MWSLQASFHHYTNIASALPSLARRIVREEIHWGETVVFEAFCEVWCPKTNTVLSSVGELSISLWDLYILGGLPIRGSLYEEVIPEAMELTGTDAKDQRYTPRVCEYLFAAFHYLQESQSDNSIVSLRKWIGFWYKKPLKYENAPLRREKKTAHLKSTHNPSGIIPETSKWSRDEEGVFHKLGMRPFATTLSAPRDRVRAILSSDLKKHPTVAVSVFDGKKVFLSYRNIFISKLWTVIRGKLSRSDVDCASSLKEEVQVTLDEIDDKDVDVSPLMKLLKSFFELAALYDEARSTLHYKDMEATRKEFSITAGERLSNAMLEEHEKIEKVSSIHQSLSKVKEKIEKLHRKEKDLEILLAATEKEVEETKLGVSTAEKNFDACNDDDEAHSQYPGIDNTHPRTLLSRPSIFLLGLCDEPGCYICITMERRLRRPHLKRSVEVDLHSEVQFFIWSMFLRSGQGPAYHPVKRV
ncbi:hypothetical protein HAX54_028235 [Datura stramonium]|uniref:Aminotransferase-like plant mobile domain-containing protein n=1 Tax=Datura stramonium TaxID=4076 RepID=A0ABS8S9G2_DATST|nr:hypothetical protein [Datura stramonium]